MKKLGKIHVCGLTFTVFEGNAEERDTLGGSYGYCDHGRQEIWLREGMSAPMRKDTLLHEALHALMQHSGAENFLDGVLRPEVNRETTVETLIRILTPHLSPVLTSLQSLRVSA